MEAFGHVGSLFVAVPVERSCGLKPKLGLAAREECGEDVKAWR